MSSTRVPRPNSGFATLRRFVRERAPAERCELCSAALAERHAHLIDTMTRKVTCSCEPCAILFTSDAATKYRRIPRRMRSLPHFRLADGQWDALMIPINLAFFFHSTPAGRVVALYPSPAGPTESLLELEAWDEIVSENPVLAGMEPDVEALLVNRIGIARDVALAEYYIAPIDECFKLVGLIRSHWRGLSGGAEVWEEIGRFFGELKARATPYEEARRA
jgi:hypothetical protein